MQNDSDKPPVIFVQDGDVFVDSRDVAAMFQKRHDHVLRDIDRLLAKDQDLKSDFTPATYGAIPASIFGDCNINGLAPFEGYRCYHMTRDGFTLLAMGFTGSKALKFKVAYIEAFRAMEAELRRQREKPPAVIDASDPEVLAEVQRQLLAWKPEQEMPSRLPAH